MAESYDFSVELKPKKNPTKSAVWACFGYTADSSDAAESPVCRLCWKNRVCKRVSSGGGNTSNLFSHLQHHHPQEFLAVKNQGAKQQGTKKKDSPSPAPALKQTSLADTSKYSRSSHRWRVVTDAVTYCLAKDMMPLYSVEKDGFRRLIQVLDSRYELPGRKYFSQVAIPQLYSRTRDSVLDELKNLKYFSATTDLWSSSTMEPYISLTVHFITEEWRLDSKCLQVLFIPEDHTGKNLAEALKLSLEQWSLQQDSLVAITTDNGSNVILASQILGWRRLSCFGHNLHLAVTNAVKNDDRVARAFGVCKKLVSCFSHSWKKRRELLLAQQGLDIPKHTLFTVSYPG